MPAALQRDALALAVALSDQRKGELVGEDLVIGEPLARLFIHALMRGGERFVPVGPALARLQRRFDPFGQRRQLRQRLRRQGGDALLPQPLGERIDGLRLADLVGLARLHHVVGMDDLPRLAPDLELARRQPRLAQRPELLRPARIAAEIDQSDMVADRILGDHPRGPASGARAIAGRGERDDDLLARAGLIGIVDAPTADEAGGQMIGHVLDPRNAQPRERLLQADADALEALDLGECGVEYIGAHGYRKKRNALTCAAGWNPDPS